MTKQELRVELEAILGSTGLTTDLDELQVEELPEAKVAGIVSHPKFDGKELPERRDLVWPLLRQRLGGRAQFVGTLLLFTPEEYAALRAA